LYTVTIRGLTKTGWFFLGVFTQAAVALGIQARRLGAMILDFVSTFARQHSL
jgi:hypothetical protein